MLAESLRSIDYKIATGSLKILRQGGRVKITHAELLRQAGIDDNTPIVPRRQQRPRELIPGQRESKQPDPHDRSKRLVTPMSSIWPA